MKFLTIDTNLGFEMARRFGKDKNISYYAIVQYEPYPKLENNITGYGFEEIIKVDDWGDVIEAADVVVFTDVGFGNWADFLREKGKAVFGTDGITEMLELDRIRFHEVFKNLNIKTAKYRIVKGKTKLIQEIQEGQRKFVKVNKVRGNVETFFADSKEDAGVLLQQAGFGVLSEDVWFIIEDELKGIEVGVDAFFDGKEFLNIIAETQEIKGTGNITKFVEKEESRWYEEVLSKLEGYLRKNGYRGMICFEGFVNEEGIFVIDPTCRIPYPCGYAYPHCIQNFSEVVEKVAKGEDVEIKTDCKWSVQIGLYTDDDKTWRRIKIDENVEKQVAFRRVVKKNNKYYFVPGDFLVATAIGKANTIAGAFVNARAIVNGISCVNVYQQAEVFEREIMKLREKHKEYGVLI